MNTKVLKVQDFSKLFEVPISEIPSECANLIKKGNFKYKYPTSEERDAIILMIIKIIESNKLFNAGKDSKKIWEKIWRAHLARFKSSKFNLDELIPDFFRSGDIIRLYGDFAIANNPKIKFDFYNIQRQWLFRKYFKNVDSVYEFGCGTGHNLVALAQLYPQKKLYGLDWIPQIAELIEILAKQHKFNIEGKVFDMQSPKLSLPIDNSAFLTTWSLEQLGTRFEKFIDFILAKKPKIVIDINSFVELCNPDKLTEYLTIQFNHRRSYLEGYLDYLKILQKKGAIKIHKIHNMQFGTLFHNGFSYVVWSPRSKNIK